MEDKEAQLLALVQTRDKAIKAADKECDRKIRPALSRYNKARAKAEAALETRVAEINAEFFKAKKKAGL